MTTAATLRQQAATYESKRQLDKALATYRELLDRHASAEEVDVALRNRVGDLMLRVGAADEAIALFERSAEEYALQGFLSNAIALCNKILRHRPGHVGTLRRLARYCAEKGLVLDAQRHYLGVAEALERQGQHGEALKALGEFAEVSPADVHVRTVVVEQLLKAGHRSDALPHLTVLHRLHAEAGRAAEADAVSVVAREIDASWEPETPGGGGGGGRGGSGLVFLSHDSDFEAIAPAAPEAPAPLAGFEATAAPSFDPPALAPGAVDGFEATSYDAHVVALPGGPDAAPSAPPVEFVEFDDPTFPPADGAGGTPAPGGYDSTFYDSLVSTATERSGAHPAIPEFDGAAEARRLTDPYSRALPLPAFEVAADEPPALTLDEALSLPALGVPAADPVGGGAGTTGARGGDFVNLADLLGGDEERDSRMTVGEPVQSGDEDADLQRILREFRAGIEQTIPHDDAESHYDLGIAFKEMGLLDDAISEFQIALRSPARRLEATEALGGCFLAKGDAAIARTVLLQGLAGQGASDDVLRGVLYLLGRAEEAVGARDEAVGYYQRVYAVDIRFRDVAARLRTLQQPT